MANFASSNRQEIYSSFVEGLFGAPRDHAGRYISKETATAISFLELGGLRKPNPLFQHLATTALVAVTSMAIWGLKMAVKKYAGA